MALQIHYQSNNLTLKKARRHDADGTNFSRITGTSGEYW